MWMDPESVIQSEVKSETEKCHILMHICGTQKNGTNEPISRARLEAQTQRMDTWTQGGKRRARRVGRLGPTRTLPRVNS